MTGPVQCELCEDPLGRGHDLVGGLALCRRCFNGHVERVADARGWVLKSTHGQVHSENSDSTWYRTDAHIRLSAPSGLRAVCRRNRWWMPVLGLVRSSARSRDPLFDRHVRVWTPVPRAVEAFMQAPAVESALLDALGNVGNAFVRIDGGDLRVHYMTDDPHAEGEAVARACVLAHLLARFTAGTERPGAGGYGAPGGRST